MDIKEILKNVLNDKMNMDEAEKIIAEKIAAAKGKGRVAAQITEPVGTEEYSVVLYRDIVVEEDGEKYWNRNAGKTSLVAANNINGLVKEIDAKFKNSKELIKELDESKKESEERSKKAKEGAAKRKVKE